MAADKEMNWKAREEGERSSPELPKVKEAMGAELLSHTHASHAAKEPSPAHFRAPVR